MTNAKNNVQASALRKLRHPSILGKIVSVFTRYYLTHRIPEMVEPLEETRSELTFATEPLLSSLYLSIPTSPRATPLVELDEVEVSLSP